MKRFGTQYGGFYYPKNLDNLNKDSVIYCVGAGEDISHDIELAHQLNSNVYIFDPTPRAIEHVKYIKSIMDNKVEIINSKRYGGGDPNYLKNIMDNKIDSNKIHFYDYGLYTENTTVKFYKPENEEYVSHSAVLGMKSENYIKAKMKNLMTIMKELGHKKIDLLKIDIEGCECDVLKQMIENNIYPTYLSVDFDLGWHCPNTIKDRERCIKIIELLMQKGYQMLYNIGSDFSFVKK